MNDTYSIPSQPIDPTNLKTLENQYATNQPPQGEGILPLTRAMGTDKAVAETVKQTADFKS